MGGEVPLEAVDLVEVRVEGPGDREVDVAGGRKKISLRSHDSEGPRPYRRASRQAGLTVLGKSGSLETAPPATG